MAAAEGRGSVLASMGLGDWLSSGGGVGAKLGTVLMLGLGAGLVGVSATDAREVFRGGPLALSCAEFVEHPLERARWVSLSGCRLDLPAAASRRWKGWAPLKADAGVGSKQPRTMELYLPLAPVGAESGTATPVIVASKDPALLQLADQLAALRPEEAVRWIDAHRADVEAALAPPALVGYAETVTSWASRSAMNALEAQGSVILVHDGGPNTGNALLGLAAGFLLMVWALLPVMRKLALWWESPRPPSAP